MPFTLDKRAGLCLGLRNLDLTTAQRIATVSQQNGVVAWLHWQSHEVCLPAHGILFGAVGSALPGTRVADPTGQPLFQAIEQVKGARMV